MDVTQYLKVYSLQEKPGRVLLFATRRCSILECSAALWERIQAGKELSEKETATLVRLGVLVPDRAAECEEMRGTFEKLNVEARQFCATATLTLDCNLACPYCFEDPFRGRLRMSNETAELLVQRLVERMQEGLDVQVDFYGGEALMALPLLKDMATRLGRAAGDHGVKFGFNLFSNGVLLSRKAVEGLLPLGLEAVRLTIDGPCDIHDAQRPLVSGRGSFESIVSNLLDVYELVQIDLSGNYTSENYRRFPELLDLLLEKGIDPRRFKAVGFTPVMPKADGTATGDFGSACASCNEPWAIEAALFLRGETLKRGFPVDKLRASACMIEFENEWVVGYDGGIYKCPVFMGQEDMRIGTLADGVGDYSKTYNLDVWKTDECLDCAYLPLCFGGCRFLRKLKTGAIDGIDCRRGYYDQALERLVRQDLRLP